MTRDSQPIRDHELLSDAEVYAALWSVAPPSRLPEDAPSELRELTIDLDDPKRVYAIYRASRRHYFQVLIARYIHQIRYGCQSNTCSTTTCFSCRKRLAGGAPIRRYNATGARTLAVYMASQDNPERGFCHNPSAEYPTSRGSKPPKQRRGVKGDDNAIPNPVDSRRLKEDNGVSKTITAHATEITIDRGGSQSCEGSRSNGGDAKKITGLDVHFLDEPIKTDHRSFVQNVFGTVAFKMVEWLTPRNLELLSKLRDANNATVEIITSPERSTSSGIVTEDTVAYDGTNNRVDGLVSTPDSQDSITEPAIERDAPLQRPPKTNLSPELDGSGEANIQKSGGVKSNTVATPKRRTSSAMRKKSEPPESQLPKGILNISSKTVEPPTDMVSLSQRMSPMPRRKLSRQTLITSPILSVAEDIPPPPDTKSLPKAVTTRKSKSSKEEVEKLTKELSISEISGAPLPKLPKVSKIPKRQKSKALNLQLPQSLSNLSIETIGFLCDVMQEYGTCEKHTLQPQIVDEGLKRHRQKSLVLHRNPAAYPSSDKEQWRKFIEQSFFDVLGNPDSLIRSFCDEKSRILDTQTMWYLMLRMTRVAPSLVFDSLWNVAGALFKPPKELEETYEWAKEFHSQQGLSTQAVSDTDAAQVINICLHGLVATIPLASDARQLANMSRIRSYGLAMLGRNSSSLEPVTLCLQYEDAFKNELAMRLARRLFAAIPIRRRFTELLELQDDIRNGSGLQQDVLDIVLENLKFLDSGSPPLLEFSEDERDLHERRIPTLILDWARTVMFQDWQGTGEVPRDGPFGGALTMVAAIYENRKSLLVGDIIFRTEYFSERLDPIGTPLEWLSLQSNKRTFHLLDHPYLFNPATLVTYFRAINYSRMNKAYELAKGSFGHMYTTMSANTLMTNEESREILCDRMRTATSRFMVLEIRRNNVLLDTFNSVWRREERELMRPLKIRLGEDGGEEGLDSGGVQQEFFRLAIAEALNPDYGTFTIEDRTKMTWFQPGSPEPLWKFELIGIIISLAVYNGLTLPVTFPKALYHKLLDEDISELHHIADGWPDLASGLTTLLEWDEKDGAVEDIFARTYEFSVEQFGQPVSRDMGTSAHWPQFSDVQSSSTNPDDAPLVTNDNRDNYVSDYIRWLTDISIRPQFEAFKAGFFSCIDRRSITLFDPSTLQSVVEGIQEIDIPELRRTTRYIGWDASHKAVRDFWSIVKRYDIEQKKKLLEFVTASDRVPVGGIKNLQFTLQRNGVDDGHLPSSYTCYGILLLPEYSSKEVLREKMAMALENSKGFGFA